MLYYDVLLPVVKDNAQLKAVLVHCKLSVNGVELFEMKEDVMQKWECPCGYIYDPEEGDYENGVEPGTPWEKVPEDWVCPKCGAAKEEFWLAD